MNGRLVYFFIYYYVERNEILESIIAPQKAVCEGRSGELEKNLVEGNNRENREFCIYKSLLNGAQLIYYRFLDYGWSLLVSSSELTRTKRQYTL